MFKKFIHKHSITLSAIAIVFIIFFVGVIFGRCTKPDASVEATEVITSYPTTTKTTGATDVTERPTNKATEGTERPTVETVAATDVTEQPTAITTKTEETTVQQGQPKKMEVTARAYCACVECCGKTDGITATGTQATAGRTIAVDPAVIPYGARVVINGHTYIAEDCGGAVNDNAIDIFFNTHAEALEFGVQDLTAFIYE